MIALPIPVKGSCSHPSGPDYGVALPRREIGHFGDAMSEIFATRPKQNSRVTRDPGRRPRAAATIGLVAISSGWRPSISTRGSPWKAGSARGASRRSTSTCSMPCVVSCLHAEAKPLRFLRSVTPARIHEEGDPGSKRLQFVCRRPFRPLARSGASRSQIDDVVGTRQCGNLAACEE